MTQQSVYSASHGSFNGKLKCGGHYYFRYRRPSANPIPSRDAMPVFRDRFLIFSPKTSVPPLQVIVCMPQAVLIQDSLYRGLPVPSNGTHTYEYEPYSHHLFFVMVNELGACDGWCHTPTANDKQRQGLAHSSQGPLCSRGMSVEQG
jgi:hypothetical protein